MISKPDARVASGLEPLVFYFVELGRSPVGYLVDVHATSGRLSLSDKKPPEIKSKSG
jgi:hypothetical protein